MNVITIVEIVKKTQVNVQVVEILKTIIEKISHKLIIPVHANLIFLILGLKPCVVLWLSLMNVWIVAILA